MRMRFFLITFILSLLFWWGINALFDQELAKQPELFFSEQKLEELKLDRARRNNFKELELSSQAAISVRVDRQGNEFILFERNSQKPLPIASLTKLMTGLVVFDNYDLTDSTKELIHAMLIESNNDAAETLAEKISYDAFVDLMNIYSKNIGLENTNFVNPTGLEPDDPKEDMNYSTTKDLVKLAKLINKKYPEIFEITRYQVPQNTNELLGRVGGIIGGKTGWAPAAGGCLLLVLDDPNSNSYFINIVLGAHDRFAEMHKLINVIR